MKKYASQISVAIVCCILGFMLTYQFKLISQREQSQIDTNASSDITAEIADLKKQKQDLQDKINSLQTQIKKYETAAASGDASSKQLLDELKDSRLVNGTVDVKGQGIVISFVPDNGLFGSNTGAMIMQPEYLTRLVNYLNAWEAEAVSINDVRITTRTGIVLAGNAIKINNQRIDPTQKIVIKAIGNKDKLLSAVNFKGIMPALDHWVVTVEPSDNIEISKYTGNFKMDYAKPVESK